MEREKEIEKKLKAAVEKEGGLCFKFLSSVAGVPDRICLFDGGVIVFVELKAPGRKPRKLQEVQIKKLRNLGFRVEVIDSEKGIGELIWSVRMKKGEEGGRRKDTEYQNKKEVKGNE